VHWTRRSRGMGISALGHLSALLGLRVVAIFWQEPRAVPVFSAPPVRPDCAGSEIKAQATIRRR